MYCASYMFTVNTALPDAEARFVKCWTALSNFFRREAGALESTLHRGSGGENADSYFAHAYWPDLETYTASRELTPDAEFMSLRLDWAELVLNTDLVFEGVRISSV